ncbi:MAG: threonine ammonia-lyase [Nostocoides sp.]
MATVTVTPDDIRAAREILSEVIEPTPLEHNRALSERSGVDVFLKCENLQRAGSFKVRGAYTRMSRLTPEEKARGVVAASAGNHAQGVALAARMLGIEARIYMPLGAPMPKIAATKGYGATVELTGQTLEDALVVAKQSEIDTGAVLIHPFDHTDIVAGQGTCGLEILDQCPDVRTILVSTGGGGLLAGIAIAVKDVKPDTTVIGVQAAQAAAYPLSLKAGKPTLFRNMATMADGIAVGLPGTVTFPLVRDLVDGVEVVSEDSLSRALLFLLERAKMVVEPAGGAAVAHLMQSQGTKDWDGPLVAVLSGGNIDPILMLRIIRHGMTAAGRYLQITVRVPDRPGRLAQLLLDCAETDANVVEVEHLRTASTLAIHDVEITVQLETKGPAHCEEVLRVLRAKGYTVQVGRPENS